MRLGCPWGGAARVLMAGTQGSGNGQEAAAELRGGSWSLKELKPSVLWGVEGSCRVGSSTLRKTEVQVGPYRAPRAEAGTHRERLEVASV